MSRRATAVRLFSRSDTWWFPSAWWSKSGVTVTPLRSGRWLLMQSFASGWVATSRTTARLTGSRARIRLLLDEEVKKMLQNKPPRRVGEDSPPVAVDEDFMGLYPKLWTFLTSTQWEDGTSRQPSTVSIFMQGGRWTICLTEKNWDLILFATADRLEGVWEALDARLSDPKADWRENRSKAGDRAKRVQRPS